jgi:uncharacterized protein YbjT (DUF2867 family)
MAMRKIKKTAGKTMRVRPATAVKRTMKSTTDVPRAPREKIILVTGAMGHQGNAVARTLAAEGWRVRALVRDPLKQAARMLAIRGIDLVKGDLTDRASIDKALKGAYGVFGVFTWAAKGVKGEIRQGKALADAAKAARIKHFVYSSAVGADRKTGVPGFDGKWEIEQHIRKIGLPATIFRPAFFMYNFEAADIQKNIMEGVFTLALKADRPVQMLAVEDLAIFVNLAFKKPEEYIGKAIDLAGVELTMTEAAEAFSRAVGKPVRFIEQSIAEVRRFNKDMARMFEWLNENRGHADIPALRSLHPGLMTLDTWLRWAGWARAA